MAALQPANTQHEEQVCHYLALKPSVQLAKVDYLEGLIATVRVRPGIDTYRMESGQRIFMTWNALARGHNLRGSGCRGGKLSVQTIAPPILH